MSLHAAVVMRSAAFLSAASLGAAFLGAAFLGAAFLGAAFLGAVVLLGCGGDDDGVDGAGCEMPAVLEGGVCVTPGGCDAGALPLDDGGCLAAGVPEALCGAGFESDGAGACRAILPAAPCPSGAMALPGETSCREVAGCGAGTWGDIPLGADTVFVDASYGGGAGTSDGSQQRPFATIGEAFVAANAGATVAIAAGSYAEDLDLFGKPVVLWGVCPSLSEIVATGSGQAALVLRSGTAGSEVHALAVRGPRLGIAVTGAIDVLLDRVWVHDTGDAGIVVEDALGNTAVTVRGALIERASDGGVRVGGAQLLLESSVIRYTQPFGTAQSGGGGVAAYDTAVAGRRAELSLRDSVIEANRDVGVAVAGADALLERVLVRGTLPRASDQDAGVGVVVRTNGTSGQPAAVTIRSTVVEDNHAVGVYSYGSTALLEAVTVRHTLANVSDGLFGRGVVGQADTTTGLRTTLTLRSSLISESIDVGVLLLGTDATVETTRVSATRPRTSDGLFGDGVVIAGEGAEASATLRGLVVQDSARAGIGLFGARADVGHTHLSCNAVQLTADGLLGQPSIFGDLGGNRCACDGDEQTCKALSAGLEPPSAAEPTGQ
jgi:hypothetical protein